MDLARLATHEDLRARDITWMLFRPDRAYRDTAAKMLQRMRDPETVMAFVTEARGKPEAAFRAATPILFSPPLPGIDAELADLGREGTR